MNMRDAPAPSLQVPLAEQASFALPSDHGGQRIARYLLVQGHHSLGDVLHRTGHSLVGTNCFQLQPNALKMAPELDELGHVIPCPHQIFGEDLTR